MKNNSNVNLHQNPTSFSSKIKFGFKEKMNRLADIIESNIYAHSSFDHTAVFGPVHSRRIGYSLGVNNIKHKICSYDCIYCPRGKTTRCSTQRDCCLSPYELYFFVKRKIEDLEKNNIPIEYISFVPNGEPTLDDKLSTEISLLREFGYKLAVFTNGSMVWNDRVQETLQFADYVSIKIDTVDEEIWRSLNRPHKQLQFDLILEGISDFSKYFQGELTTETMLVKDHNDTAESVRSTGQFLTTLKRKASYFTIPIRPPVEPYAVPPDPIVLSALSKYILDTIPNSQMLIDPGTMDVTTVGNLEEDLLGILSVLPMTETEARVFVNRHHGNDHDLNQMMQRGLIRKTMFQNTSYYARVY